MPIVVGVTPPPPTPPVIVARPRATWIAPDGTEVPLTTPGLGWYTLRGVAGTGAPPISIARDDHPDGGIRARHTQPLARLITWPLRVHGPDPDTFAERWRYLVTKITQTDRLGPGTLRIQRPNGTEREILALYEAGLNGEPGQDFHAASPILTLLCEDPHWRDTVTQTVVREFGAGVPFLDPYPTVSSGSVLGATTVFNPGDVKAKPVWTIDGPASLITATNNTTGEEFVLDPDFDGHGDLLLGEQITITTDPPAVRFENGDNWTGALNWPGAVLWGLEPGDNDIEFTLADAGAGSRIQLSYVARYKTA